ncbi:hypothetical protein H696_01118 [Fonticula alba]|uniref:Ribosome biogenesis protein BOP1 homolog n=1 Tax=Fonticula alba TaxID=691883 RepID=A0A058ZB93_FONAL|nr:hypothetical protein H696_01118 [Fonticula alba]KCV71695.1 hypothetical protein H696_01118 [Fonticula alba]|eukprot:XP_009493273.1 hypothetical protein H696_01118 [Fonticula alba]
MAAAPRASNSAAALAGRKRSTRSDDAPLTRSQTKTKADRADDTALAALMADQSAVLGEDDSSSGEEQGSTASEAESDDLADFNSDPDVTSSEDEDDDAPEGEDVDSGNDASEDELNRMLAAEDGESDSSESYDEESEEESSDEEEIEPAVTLSGLRVVQRGRHLDMPDTLPSEDEDPATAPGHSTDEEIRQALERNRPNIPGPLEHVPAFPFQQDVDSSDEAPSDLSDDEHTTNPVGRGIPSEWYADHPHIGYDLDGKRIMKPLESLDELDRFLAKMGTDAENDDYWRTVKDKYGASLKLSDEELQLIDRIISGRYAEQESANMYPEMIEYYSGKPMAHPLPQPTEPKRRFIPSKWEGQKVMKLVRAVRMGWLTPRAAKKDSRPKYYNIWAKESSEEAPNSSASSNYIPAPKMRLPGHNASYNPPEEYLWTEEEIREWEEAHPEDRKAKFIPRKYDSLRQVPANPQLIQDMFERCLDLYLCPRVRKNRLQIDPESLIPRLPRPRELRPYPTTESIRYEGHTGKVRSISVCPTGEWLLSGSDDGTVRVFEVSTGRCAFSLDLGQRVNAVAWNPMPGTFLFTAAADSTVFFVAPPAVGTLEATEMTRSLIRSSIEKKGSFSAPPNARPVHIDWVLPSEEEAAKSIVLKLEHRFVVTRLAWHRRGDYLATVCADGLSRAIAIHQLSRHMSQHPFSRNLGHIERVLFDPAKPHLVVATQKTVRIYNLQKQQLVKRLRSSSNHISSVALHPAGGEHVLVGTFDRRVGWYDLELSSDRPYRTLLYHKYAVRAVAYHNSYPLFASCSDDGTAQVFHGRVFSDLLQNALIVPLKILTGHRIVDGFGIMDCAFHPSRPWLFTAGADGTVRLFV